MTRARGRLTAFVVVLALVVCGTVVYLVGLVRSQAESRAAAAPAAASARPEPLPTDGYIAFRRTEVDAGYGSVGVVPLGRPDAVPVTHPELSCERIHMSRNGGVCLDVDRSAVTTARVLLLGPDLTVRHTLSSPGIPSRARVSPDGRWAATTTFVTGHSYASTGFSTQTEIYDMQSGRSLGNVETFRMTRAGRPFTAKDVNVWGVTFAADGSSFFATVMSGGRKHLARGDLAERTLALTDVVAECPSLSPSGTRIAYKRATGPTTWQVRVRTLADGKDVLVDESRSVDDQIEWLDDSHVMFGLARPGGGATSDVWVAPADGTGPAELLLRAAWSPAVVRAG